MSTPPVGQDAAVAVLQMQQTTLESSMREIAKTMSEGFASINAKMDRVNDIALSIAQMSGRQEAHSDGLQRAFSELKTLRETLDRSIDESANWRDNYARDVEGRFATRDAFRQQYIEQHAKDHSQIGKSMATAKGMLVGAGLAYGVLVSILTWGAATYIGETRKNTAAIHQIQLDNAKASRTSP